MREAAIRNGTGHGIRPRLLCVLLVAPLLVLTGSHAVSAAPQDLTRAQGEAAALEAQLKELKNQAAVLSQKYDAATAQLAQTEAEAAENAALLTQAQQDEASAVAALNQRLAEIYKQGRAATLTILLSSGSFSELMDRVTLLQRISKQDSDLVQQVSTYRAQVATEGGKLAAQLESRQDIAQEVEAASQAMTQKLAQTRELLKGKEAEVAQLEKEWQAEQARQAKLQQERQAKLDEALAAAQAAAQEAGSGGGSGGAGGGTSSTVASTTTTKSGGKSTTTTAKGTAGTTTTTRPATTTTTSGGQTHHAGVTNILKPEQIALVAQKAGFSGNGLVIAVAVAMAESGSNANAVGSNTYGLWQILSYAHPDMINPKDPDASKWYDPYVNATFAWKISSRGTNWRPWSVYTSGAYLKKMDAAQAGVDLLLSNPGVVVPPSVK